MVGPCVLAGHPDGDGNGTMVMNIVLSVSDVNLKFWKCHCLCYMYSCRTS